MNEYEQLVIEIENIIKEDKLYVFMVNDIKDRIEVLRNKQSKFRSIKQIIAKYHELTENEICLKSRKRVIVEARQIAMYFYSRFTKLSLNGISLELTDSGHKFDHATVLFAIDTVNDLMDSDKRFKAKIEEIEQEVKRHY